MAVNCGSGLLHGSPFSGHNVNQSSSVAIAGVGVVSSSSKVGTGNGAGSSGALNLKHDPGLALEWSAEEQSVLEDGLQQFANESSILKYIKIAALLPEKTVRDVALRCRWMSKKENGKRRKADEQTATKKPKDRKDRFVDALSKQSSRLAQQTNMVAYSSPMFSMDNEGVPLYEKIDNAARHLLEQNAKVFEQITENLANYRIRENISLLCLTRDNIVTILNDMKDTPGIMSQMPPLPVKINEDLADSLLLMQHQTVGLDISNLRLKQEMR